MTEWNKALAEFLKQQQWSEAIAFIEQDKTKHAGTAPGKIKRKVIKLINATFDSHTILTIAQAFGNDSSPTAKEISAFLLPSVYRVQPEQINELMHRIADDVNWEVREWAAGGCGEMLAEFYDDFFPVMKEWTFDRSENIRRAASLSVMYASKHLSGDYANELLSILEPLMADSSAYVKKNLGPFAIGDALLKRYPVQTIAWLKEMAKSVNEHVRWNVAMVFTSAASRRFVDDGESILTMLMDDERKSVERAVKKAQRNLEKATSRVR